MSALAVQNVVENWPKADNFKEELKKIGNKYSSFFKERKPVVNWQEHDDLNQHYVIIADNHKILFSFTPTTDIPLYIRKECEDAFFKNFEISQTK